MTDLERLVAIEEIRTLQSRYVRYADTKNWQALAGLFLPGASFIPHDINGKPQVTMTGREEIASTINASVGGGTALHHLFSYEIDIETPTRARGVWAMEDWLDRTNDDDFDRGRRAVQDHARLWPLSRGLRESRRCLVHRGPKAIPRKARFHQLTVNERKTFRVKYTRHPAVCYRHP